MSAKHSPLDTLINLAQKRTESAVRSLGELQTQRNQAGHQLEALYDYKQDYRQRLQNAMRNGVPAAHYQNYEQFLTVLDNVIDQQHKVVLTADQQLEQGREQWRQAKRKLDSFDTLVQRQQKTIALQQQRREQRQTDEQSIRAYLRAGAGTF
ncbi:flagellar export protein FliJ [Corticimicrobacter populi]|uniref:Flagellar FliJ protein n=1 Tax=Corticimicrobacter populi TaxID=2175229 RepID=A0A2V1JTG5_9BURK|nr:flagellar export protein FliJ [Corticimicrobacter populi]PWF21174.1 flagellar export protein FliJ [Corticimicrobacter populi]